MTRLPVPNQVYQSQLSVVNFNRCYLAPSVKLPASHWSYSISINRTLYKWPRDKENFKLQLTLRVPPMLLIFLQLIV